MGTLHYMSPEQVRGQPLDARSDIFSFGRGALRDAYGHRAFRQTNAGRHHRRHFDGRRRRSNDLPPQLQSIVARSLQKDRERRYQTSNELLLDLKSLNRELELSDEPGRVLPQTNEVVAHATSRADRAAIFAASRAGDSAFGRTGLGRSVVVYLPAQRAFAAVAEDGGGRHLA